VMGIVTTTVLLALHVKAAVALGVLAGLLEFVPTIGAILSSVPAIAMGFLDSPEKAVYVTVAYVAIHFLESHTLIPLLMKGRVNLPPALTIISQALMALLFGFLGLMCAVPLLAAVMTAVQLLYVDRLIGTVVIGSNQTVVTID
jgi:predicted PurR-regulated permease PerM